MTPKLQTSIAGCQSLTTTQLRGSRGQPTARVCLCCFKGSHQGMLLNDCYLYAKGSILLPSTVPPFLYPHHGGLRPLSLSLLLRLCCRKLIDHSQWLQSCCRKQGNTRLNHQPPRQQGKLTTPSLHPASIQSSRPTPSQAMSVATAKSCSSLVIQQTHSSVSDWPSQGGWSLPDRFPNQ